MRKEREANKAASIFGAFCVLSLLVSSSEQLQFKCDTVAREGTLKASREHSSSTHVGCHKFYDELLSGRTFHESSREKLRRESLSRALVPLSLLRLRVSDCTGSASLHITLNIIIILRYRYEKDNIAFIHSDL